MGLTRRPVLVLNASYEPINICAAQRALVMLVKGVATVEEADELILVYPSIPLPLVIRLREYRRVPTQRQDLSRKNILLRDHHTCQYCGVKETAGKLTLDHVMPRSRGGGDTWENLVSCCGPCNRKKANKTPEEANMPLLRRPRPATLHTHRHIMRSAGGEQIRWQKYLFF